MHEARRREMQSAGGGAAMGPEWHNKSLDRWSTASIQVKHPAVIAPLFSSPSPQLITLTEQEDCYRQVPPMPKLPKRGMR